MPASTTHLHLRMLGRASARGSAILQWSSPDGLRVTVLHPCPRWELYHGTSAWQHLVKITGAPVRKRSLLTYQPDLYAYDLSTCELPAYAELGRICLSEDPGARPTFTEIVAALEAMKGVVENGMMGAPSRGVPPLCLPDQQGKEASTTTEASSSDAPTVVQQDGSLAHANVQLSPIPAADVDMPKNADVDVDAVRVVVL